MHHLINELRPHQARETIRVTMQAQKRQRAETTARLNKQIDKVNEIIQTCISSIPDANESSSDAVDIQSLIDFKLPLDSDEINTNESNDNFSQSESDANEKDAFMCSLVDDL